MAVDPGHVPGAEERVPERLTDIERRLRALEQGGSGGFVVPTGSTVPTITAPEGALRARNGGTRALYIVLDGAVRTIAVT